jgi:hypothetical protein
MNTLEPSAVSHALLLMKAEQLTRQGHFREAEALFGGDEARPPEDPLLLHGLATVVTRSGDYPRARRLWRLLQHRQPGHREAERMLAALDCWEERPLWVRLAPAMSAALLVMAVGIWFWQVQTEPGAAMATAPAQPAPVQTTPMRVSAPAPAAPVNPTPIRAVVAPPPPIEEPLPPVKFQMPPAKPAKR